MARINKYGYLDRVVPSSPKRGGRNTGSKYTVRRDWWLVKDYGSYTPLIPIRGISLPKNYIGKRIRLKIQIEEVEDGK